MSATPMAHYLEYADWWNPILDEPLRVENGLAMIGSAIGTGVSWNQKAIERFAV